MMAINLRKQQALDADPKAIQQINFTGNLKFWIIFWDFLMFNQIFFLPQVKQCAIITCKHSIYELHHKLPNNLKHRILGNEEISGKPQNFIEWLPSAHSSCQNEDYDNFNKKLLKNRN